jgi:hypothetical protein
LCRDVSGSVEAAWTVECIEGAAQWEDCTVNNVRRSATGEKRKEEQTYRQEPSKQGEAMAEEQWMTNYWFRQPEDRVQPVVGGRQSTIKLLSELEWLALCTVGWVWEGVEMSPACQAVLDDHWQEGSEWAVGQMEMARQAGEADLINSLVRKWPGNVRG